MEPPFRNENRKQAPFTEIVHSRHRPLGPWFTCSLCVHFAASTVGPAVRGCWCGSITAKDSFCFVPVDLFVLCLCACAASLSRFSFLSLTQSSRSLARFCSEFKWQLVWQLLSVLSDFLKSFRRSVVLSELLRHRRCSLSVLSNVSLGSVLKSSGRLRELLFARASLLLCTAHQ